MSTVDPAIIVIMPYVSCDDIPNPDTVDPGMFVVLDISTPDINCIGIIDYLDHLGSWGFQTRENVAPVLAFNGEMESTMEIAIAQLISACPF